ncbi:hypothetical protein K8R30_00840 [archaeon]|nr:hypothetical protein [archaeon]
MRKILLLFTTLFLLAQASAIQITPEYSTDIIIEDFDSQILLTLKITNATPGIYNLYTLADISIQPSETFEITENFTQKEFILKPKEDLDTIGNYAFTYTLNHRGVEKYEQRMLLKIKNFEDTIEISSDSIDPSSDKISFYIQNKEDTTLENITATFSSIIFDETKTFTLEPNQKLEIPINPYENILKKTSAGVYIITATFQTKDGEKKIEGNLYLGEKKGITVTEDKSGILIQREIITKVNTGNVIESIQIQTQRNIFSRLFTSFNIEPTLVERDGMTIEYTWTKEKLNPAEAYVIKAETNYVLPFLIILFATLAILGYIRYSQTKLEIKKSVAPVKTKNGEFALKVTLSIKAKQDIENVTLIDKVPAIVKIYKKFGTIKPDKIDAESRRIHWHIGNLETGETRLFSYIVYSKVGIVGKFSLPKALAVFEKESNIHEVDSNSVFFMNEQARD